MDYNRYYNLSEAETRNLVAYCEILSPSVLENKCFFCDNDFDSNRFLELSSKEVTFAAVQSIVVLGKEATVAKIMVYPQSWKRRNYDDALYEVKRSLRPPSPVVTTYTSRRRSSSCIII